MNHNGTHHGKILNHGEGTGEVTQQDVDQRADEIAIIEGRPGGVVSAADRKRARTELMGGDLHALSEEEENSTGSVNRDPADPAASRGEHAPTLSDEDDQGVVERLALEGVEEAQHEQMLADRKRKHG